MTATYALGVDLGTTNCVLAYAPLGGDVADVRVLPIPQLVADATVEAFEALPSFLYLGDEDDTARGALDLSWAKKANTATGRLARDRAAESPTRTVAGAKSWLAHHAVDRRADILPPTPPGEQGDGHQVSPVVASQKYLEHLVAAWNAAHADAPFAEQQVVLTVPASFDASARELTREAALAAGFSDDFTLLEEPQAAVYAWLVDRGEDWRKDLGVGDRVLVCDVGGGTTDLTLVDVTEDEGALQLTRAAVGQHLLVGGDNMDLALAHYAAGQFAEKNVTLDPWQSVSLWHSCRRAKETLLAGDSEETGKAPKKAPVAVQSRGRKLIGGTSKIDLEGDAVTSLLVDGFFPACDLSDPVERTPASGFLDLGLPYETDTRVTRHVAEFVRMHQETPNAGDGPSQPTHVLFNGGVFQADAVRQRLLETLTSWFPDLPAEPLTEEADLNNAVSRGAAYYAWAKDRGGVRIRGGAARSYYVGVEAGGMAIPGVPRPLTALCVVPKGMEEGTACDVPAAGVGVVVGRPVTFRFFASTVRQDEPGARVANWGEGEIEETDPLASELTPSDGEGEQQIPVRFESKLTELGVFELWCVNAGDAAQRWKLEFSIRDE